MSKLIIFNIILIAIISGVLILLKKYCKSNKSKFIVLIILPTLTFLCHYSSLVYHYFTSGTAINFLRGNPNLILPIYPCNVVMWLALVLGLLKNKQSCFASYLIDYIFWFGFVSSIIGMFVNVDFLRNPTLLNYDVTKGIVAHAIMLLNVLTLPIFGLVKIKLERNYLNIIISIIMMYIIGLYCNLLFTVIVSSELAYSVNAMFILHSPFEGVDFLTYPIVALLAIFIYFIIFTICELILYKKGNRWYNRINQYFSSKLKLTE